MKAKERGIIMGTTIIGDLFCPNEKHDLEGAEKRSVHVAGVGVYREKKCKRCGKSVYFLGSQEISKSEFEKVWAENNGK